MQTRENCPPPESTPSPQKLRPALSHVRRRRVRREAGTTGPELFEQIATRQSSPRRSPSTGNRATSMSAAAYSFTPKRFADSGDARIIWECHKVGRDIGFRQMEKLSNLDQLLADGFWVSCFP
jgi:hypothetical protein